MSDANGIEKMNILTGNCNDEYEKKFNCHNDKSVMKLVKYVYDDISLHSRRKRETMISNNRSMSRRKTTIPK